MVPSEAENCAVCIELVSFVAVLCVLCKVIMSRSREADACAVQFVARVCHAASLQFVTWCFHMLLHGDKEPVYAPVACM